MVNARRDDFVSITLSWKCRAHDKFLKAVSFCDERFDDKLSPNTG